MKPLLKQSANFCFLLAVFPLALLSAFGRISSLYLFGAQCVALVPGLPGDYLRTAFYRLTLQAFHPSSRISFGSFFAHPNARVAESVYIGSFSVLGMTSIGARCQIASGVQILSGARQHPRDSQGRILSSHESSFSLIEIGPDCWIGAAAVIMAPIGAGSTIGAGAVVTKPIPPASIAVGVPAKVIASA